MLDALRGEETSFVEVDWNNDAVDLETPVEAIGS